LSLNAQPVFRFQLSGFLVDGSNWGSSISSISSNSGGSSISSISSISGNSRGSSISGDSGGGSVDMVRVSHNSRGNRLLDDGFALNGNWVWDVVRGINMDGGWDLNDVLGVEGSIIWGINLTLNEDRILDVVDFSLGLDNGGIDSVGSLEDSWDSDGKMRGGWLVDLGGISGHIAGLSKVHLLGDNWGGLVDGGDSSSLGVGGIRSRGSWGSISYWGMGDNWASRVVLSSISGNTDSSRSSSSIAKAMNSSSITKAMNS